MPAGIDPNCSSTSFAFATTVAQVERMSAGDSYVRRLARSHILSFGKEGKTVLILVKERSMGGGYERREVLSIHVVSG